MSRLGTFSGHLAELTAGAEPGQSLSSHLSVSILHLVLICMQDSLALAHVQLSSDSPRSAKDLFRCFSLSLWADCPSTEPRVSPVACSWQGRDTALGGAKPVWEWRVTNAEEANWLICFAGMIATFFSLSSWTNHFMDFPENPHGKTPLGSFVF